MINDIEYEYNNFSITENNDSFILEYKTSDYELEQYSLFNMMLNFGYVEIKTGTLKIRTTDIVSFWEYAKDSVLRKYSLDDYYSILGFQKLYNEKLPSIKIKGAFYSKDFSMKIVWVKVDTQTISTPISYAQEGISLKDPKYGDVLGALFPEYLELYDMVDNANRNWCTWDNSDKQNFLEHLEKQNIKRRIVIPKELSELLNRINS